MLNKQFNRCYREEQTNANDASSILSTDHNVEKITIQIPFFCAGTNFGNQDEYICPPPRPTTKNILKQLVLHNLRTTLLGKQIW